MPSATWTTLQDFEAQFDSALESILAPFEAAPFAFSIYGSGAAEVLRAPRLEFQFELGAPAGPGNGFQETVQTGTGAIRAVAWEFRLLFRVVYDRTKLSEAASAYRGELRELLAPPGTGQEGAFSAAVLPWLEVVALHESRSFRGTVGGAEAPLQLDAWESQWSGIFTVRTSALPG